MTVLVKAKVHPISAARERGMDEPAAASAGLSDRDRDGGTPA
jgi:hypothetical protein